MKVKQQSLKSFEFDISDEAGFLSYFSKNAPLFTGHLLLLKGVVTDAIRTHLQEGEFCFVEQSSCALTSKKRGSVTPVTIEAPQTKPEQKAEEQPQENVGDTLVLYRPIRSGEEIEHSGDMTLFSSVNSGARVIVEGNLAVFGIINGTVIANGEYLLLQNIVNGTVMYRGEIIDKSLLDGRPVMIRQNGSTLDIKEL